MNRYFSCALAIAAALSLASCGQGGDAAVDDGSISLIGAQIGGPFTLTDQDNKPVRWDDFKGKYRLVYFGYTYCPDVCPVDLQRLMQGFRIFEKAHPDLAAKVQPMFISVDPARDTPAVLKTYVSAFHPRLLGLSGTETQMRDVTKAFAVVYNKEPGSSPQDYFVSHSRTPYLFGPDGAPIAIAPVDDPTKPQIEDNSTEIATFLENKVH